MVIKPLLSCFCISFTPLWDSCDGNLLPTVLLVLAMSFPSFFLSFSITPNAPPIPFYHIKGSSFLSYTLKNFSIPLQVLHKFYRDFIFLYVPCRFDYRILPHNFYGIFLQIDLGTFPPSTKCSLSNQHRQSLHIPKYLHNHNNYTPSYHHHQTTSHITEPTLTCC
jgi:hypothetical protein